LFVDQAGGLAMTDKEKLLDLLYQTLSRSHCDDCLAAALVMSSVEVQQLTLSLAEDGWSKRRDGQCSCCGQAKIVSARRVSAFAA
jgi:hypothetical protein